MVRAPPCHGGSCGFEPRLPRTLSALFFLFLLILSACSPSSGNEFHEKGDRISRLLIIELKQIRSREDLLAHSIKLEELFNQLADLMIEANAASAPSFEFGLDESSGLDPSVSDQLRVELNRVIHMEGGRDVIEKVQGKALNRLDAG